MKTRSYPRPGVKHLKVTQAQEDVNWPGFRSRPWRSSWSCIKFVLLAAAGACADAVRVSIIYTALQAVWFSQAIPIVASDCR